MIACAVNYCIWRSAAKLMAHSECSGAELTMCVVFQLDDPSAFRTSVDRTITYEAIASRPAVWVECVEPGHLNEISVVFVSP